MNTFETASAECQVVTYPYPGLRSFRSDEDQIFFGRKEHRDDLLDRLENRRFLGIVGPSGCGKSSLIRAGVIPALNAGLVTSAGSFWQVATMHPGTQPLNNLAEALLTSAGPEPFAAKDAFLATVLRRGNLGLIDALKEYQFDRAAHLLILVDQFEELFRFSRAPGGAEAHAEAHAFVDLLLTSAKSEQFPITVIVTMRSDFLGKCPIFRDLPEALNDSQYLTPRLNREQQRQAIEGPASLFNTTVERDVVNRILNGMGSDPDQLPLMQHLLMRMWRKESQKATESSQPIVLTAETYRDVGGLGGCVQNHAEFIYNSFNPEAKTHEARLAELMWRRLTDVSAEEDSGDSRLVRRECEFGKLKRELVPSGDLDQVEALRNVIEAFRKEGRSFLMPPPTENLDDDKPIDISHESIIRQWKRLRDWAVDEFKITRVRSKVAEKTAKWMANDRKKEYLLFGVELAESKDWQKLYPEQLDAHQKEYVQRSIENEQAAVRNDEKAKFADQLTRKNEQLQRASCELEDKNTRLTKATCELEDKNTRLTQAADQLNANVLQLAIKNKNMRWLLGAVGIVAVVAAFLAYTTDRANTLAEENAKEAKKNEDKAKKYATEAEENLKKANKNLDKFKTEQTVTNAARLAEASRGLTPFPQLRLLLTLEAGRYLKEAAATDQEMPIVKHAFLQAVSMFDRLGIRSRALPGHHGKITSLNAAGKWLLTGSEDNTVRLWDLESELELDKNPIVLPGVFGKVSVVRIDTKERWLAAGTDDGNLFLWQRERANQTPYCVRAHVGRIMDLEFSNPEKANWLVSAAADGMAYRWDLSNPGHFTRSAADLLGHQDAITDISNSRLVITD